MVFFDMGLLLGSKIDTVMQNTRFNRVVKTKSRHGSEMTPEQCKMARAGLGLGVREVAAAAKVSTNTLTRFEAGEELRPRTIDAIRVALESAGVEFIPENGSGAGVRLKKSL
jgi:DNA-binding transcriptional regulator YiaG